MLRSMMLAVALLLCATGTAQAQQASLLTPEATAQANLFFSTLQEGRGSDAFKSVLKELVPVLGPANIDAAAMAMGQLTNGLGSILDWSVFRVNIDTPDVKQVTFLVRYEKLPMFYTLTFYNPGKGWRMVDIQGNTVMLARAAGFLGPPQ